MLMEKTTFVVNTEEYGFWPNQETIDNMHAWKECSCHVQKFTIEELEAVSNNNLSEEVESFLEKNTVDNVLFGDLMIY